MVVFSRALLPLVTLDRGTMMIRQYPVCTSVKALFLRLCLQDNIVVLSSWPLLYSVLCSTNYVSETGVLSRGTLVVVQHRYGKVDKLCQPVRWNALLASRRRIQHV